VELLWSYCGVIVELLWNYCIPVDSNLIRSKILNLVMSIFK
jgi:hypothetical protein